MAGTDSALPSDTLRVATWNVNSIKKRAQHVADWLEKTGTDVLCLQELKAETAAFPAEIFEDKGYTAAVLGQKTYNGVAILSRLPLDDVTEGLPGDDEDEQARYIEAVVQTKSGAVRVASLYLPNGNPCPGPKYDYKLAWMDRLAAHARDRLALEESLVLAGDYNVIPTEDDVHDPAAWADDALFRPDTRAKFNALAWLGFTDAFRVCDATPHCYTFWDYQSGAWPKDKGIRIDHLMLSPQAADRLQGAGIDKAPRSWDQPSDHTPAWCVLSA